MQICLFRHVCGLVFEGILELISLRYWLRYDSWGKDSQSYQGSTHAVVTPPPLLLSNTGHRNPCLSGNRSLLSTPALCLTVPPTVCAGREAPRTGETSVPQHTQEAHRVSAGPAGSRGWQALGECPLLSPGILDPVSWHPASHPKATLVSAAQPSKPWCFFLLRGSFCALTPPEASPSPTKLRPPSWGRYPQDVRTMLKWLRADLWGSFPLHGRLSLIELHHGLYLP